MLNNFLIRTRMYIDINGLTPNTINGYPVNGIVIEPNSNGQISISGSNSNITADFYTNLYTNNIIAPNYYNNLILTVNDQNQFVLVSSDYYQDIKPNIFFQHNAIGAGLYFSFFFLKFGFITIYDKTKCKYDTYSASGFSVSPTFFLPSFSASVDDIPAYSTSNSFSSVQTSAVSPVFAGLEVGVTPNTQENSFGIVFSNSIGPSTLCVNIDETVYP